jgi:transcriptional regulator with XRE-family HTH domain
MTPHIANSTDPAEGDLAVRVSLGRALSVLRTRAKLKQSEAGRLFGTTGQGWSKYEKGKAPTIFQPSVQTRLAAAVGATRVELLAEAARSTEDRPADEDWVSRNFLETADAP